MKFYLPFMRKDLTNQVKYRLTFAKEKWLRLPRQYKDCLFRTSEPLQDITIGILGPIQKNYDAYFLIMTDRYIKLTYVILMKKIERLVATAFINDGIQHYKILDSILTENDAPFVVKLFTTLCFVFIIQRCTETQHIIIRQTNKPNVATKPTPREFATTCSNNTTLSIALSTH